MTGDPLKKDIHKGYRDLYNNPEALKQREERKQQLDILIDKIVRTMPRRKPEWNKEKLMEMDRMALRAGKRCIMWDDHGNGFFLLLNWDWVTNRPRMPAPGDDVFAPGWLRNTSAMLKPPLFDPNIPVHQLAEWIDTHTMHVHHLLLPHLASIRRSTCEAEQGMFVLEPSNEYWKELNNHAAVVI